MLVRVEPVLVADHHLQRDQYGQQAERHLEHGRSFVAKAARAQVIRGDTRADQRGGDVERHRGMHEPVRKRRVEDHREPIRRKEASVDDGVSRRRLHPAIGRKDPEG